MQRVTKKFWRTRAGLWGLVLYVNQSHHCGYVHIPTGHLLYGVSYDDHVPGLDSRRDEIMEKLEDTPVGKRSFLGAMLAASDEDEDGNIKLSPALLFDVHGGITFGGWLEDEWWIGFDCAHAGDATHFGGCNFPGDVFRDVDYVAEECESLAQQVVDLLGLPDTWPEKPVWPGN